MSEIRSGSDLVDHALMAEERGFAHPGQSVPIVLAVSGPDGLDMASETDCAGIMAPSR